MVAIWLGPNLHVAVYDTRDVERILKTKGVEKADEYKYLKPWLGESILLSSGNKFKFNKKLIMPSFHVNNLKRFMDVFNDHSLTLVESLREKVGCGEFDIEKYLSKCTMDVLLETVMGISKDTLGDQTYVYSQAVHKLARLAHMRIYKFWLRPEFIFRFTKEKKSQDKYLTIVHGLTEKVIKQRKEAYESKVQQGINNDESEEKWTVFMDNLLKAQDENGLRLTDEDIKAEVMTMMFAGQDTTSTTVGFALSLLGIYQDVQDKVMAELNEVFGNSFAPITYNDLQKLQYLEQVIQETWRLYPPIPMVARKPNCDIPLDICTLPKDCSIGVLIMGVHRDPKQYKHPSKFNPDNFLPENIKTRNPYSFLPFSAGSRTCIGAKYATILIKVMVATLLRSYRVTSSWHERDFKLAGQTVLRRREGYPVSLNFHENNNVAASQ
ncbi:hypothetical protein FQR65_LT11463 [Abscondita terminalis]|nr:hypothetical protein FQR65_LT11463 [Abscondita terminalis]